MKKKDTTISFLKIILYSRAFWEHFHNLYLNESKKCPVDNLFFEHSWIIIYLKKYKSLTLSNLIKLSNKKQSSLSKTLSRLINVGYINKVRNGRQFILSLSELGEKVYIHVDEMYKKLDKEFKAKVANNKINDLISMFENINNCLGIDLNTYKEELF